MARLPKLLWLTGLSVILASAVLPGCGDDDGDDGDGETGGKAGGNTGGKAGGTTGGKGGAAPTGGKGGGTGGSVQGGEAGAPVGTGGAPVGTGGAGGVPDIGGAGAGAVSVVAGGGAGGVPEVGGAGAGGGDLGGSAGSSGEGGSAGSEVMGGAGGEESLGGSGGEGGMPPVVLEKACSGASLVGAPASPSDVGVAVTLTGDAEECSDPEFAFYGRGPGETEWALLQAYSNDETLTWTTTGEDPGTYQFQVWVRQDGSSESSETSANYSHVLEAP
jgi:hypothetical protein